jgi:hypothetical protein
MNDRISPEEKLLRLIRGQKKQSAAITDSTPLPQLNQPIKSQSKASRQSLLRRLKSGLNYRQIIIVVFGLSLIYLAILFIYPLAGSKNISLKQLPAKNPSELNIQEKERSKPYEEYIAGISGRKIFSASPAQGKELPMGVVNSDMLKEINLVGIISGDNPQAVLEDKKSLKTYYLSKGQFMGEFQIDDIQEGKIILISNGQKYELYL